jgi:hypothetical protein
VSASADLVVDAKRDLEDIGALDYDAVRLHDLKKLQLKKGMPLSSLPGLDKGILFCTYDLLISGAASKKKGKKDKGKHGPNKGKENVPPGQLFGTGPGGFPLPAVPGFGNEEEQAEEEEEEEEEFGKSGRWATA